MLKPIGGRGKKAPYETVPMRVPEPIKTQVEQLIADYRNSVLGAEVESKKDSELIGCESCLQLVNRFIEESGQSDKLHTRNNVSLVRFRNWLYSQTNRDRI